MTKRERIAKASENFALTNVSAIQHATEAEFEPDDEIAGNLLRLAELELDVMHQLLDQGAVDYHGVMPKTNNLVARARKARNLQ